MLFSGKRWSFGPDQMAQSLLFSVKEGSAGRL